MGRIAAGDLTERVGVKTLPRPVSDGVGGWLDPVTAQPDYVYAAVRVLSGLETLRLSQPVGTTIAQVTIRYRPSVTTNAEIVWQGKTFGVTQVVHDNRKEFTVLTCADNGRGN